MKSSILKIAGVLVGALALTSGAFAVPISGEIDIAAFGATAAVNFTANTVKFTPSSPGFNATVSYADGSYAGWLGNSVSYSDFNYGSAPGPVGPLTIWTTAGASFVLTSITSIIEDSTAPGFSVSLQGAGMAYLAGYTPTAGLWSFSATSTGGPKFSFSSTDTVAGVPDSGMSAVLLGLGMVGVALAGWRSKKVAQV